jgi:hypothetical protein
MSKAHLTTTNAVIDALAVVDAYGKTVESGNVAVARITGRTSTAVSNWRRFETFPSNTYVALTNALAEIGEDAPASLWAMAGARAPEVSAA